MLSSTANTVEKSALEILVEVASIKENLHFHQFREKQKIKDKTDVCFSRSGNMICQKPSHWARMDTQYLVC